MYIKVEDLKKGDEILIPTGVNLVHAILLRDPARVSGGKWWKKTKCSICATIKQSESRGYNWKTRKTEIYKSNYIKYETDIVDGPRIDKYMDLSDYRMIWLLNRE